MPTYDKSQAECHVFTFKEGLLSAVAHDLQLVCESFSIEVSDDGQQIEARFQVPSLRVVDAVVDGALAPGALSAKDKAKIQANLVKDVVGKRHPEVRFTSTEVSPSQVRGRLTIAGKAREVTIEVREEGGQRVGEVTLHQPDFGIKPYSAMLGALKIKPDIRVRVKLPA